MEATARLAEALERITAFERSIRAAQAEQLGWVHELRILMREVESHPSRTDRDNREWGDRSCTAELATALRVHERTASRVLREATALTVDLPLAHAALATGEISVQHARDLIDAVAAAPADRVAEFEQEALGKACRMTPVGFRKALQRMQHRYDPSPFEERKHRAVEERRIVVEPTADGMAWVNLFCAAEHATAIAARIAATTVTRADGDTRKKAQRDADCAIALLLGLTDAAAAPEHGDLGAVRATVNLTIPVLTMLGHGDQPPVLDGYGPIDIETARRLTAHAPSFRPILTDPVTGAMLRYGRRARRIPADLAGWLQIRDGRCRFPGCEKRAAGCDIDHTRSWEHHGCSDHDNLAHLCRKHHRVKHRTSWQMRQGHDGAIRWLSPAGRWLDSHPEHPARAG
ncbi:HNH endonuclease signature motif containing protein [Agromyces albus]|uniref:HNH endonuclease signature motif containing protein n=1 Tax=Agromyces albus TaxID=205332 RepID=UPI00278139FB|nr:HNH endonuclease signature motif containing protein [Agromyces albus]MDQ0575898.1 hypothetical protein [Agromyces albus]